MIKPLGISVVIICLFVGMCFGADPGSWEHYKSTYISEDGRIIDYFQNKSSHSEGQGYGLLLSVFFKDKATFDLVLSWTRANLMHREDSLSVWNWGQRSNGQWGIIDYNNATDGDLLIAWALLEASELWRDAKYKTSALKIIKDIRNRLTIQKNGFSLLLPGYFGFDSKGSLALNPSYYIYPAFIQFQQKEDSLFWQKISQQGLDISFKYTYSRFKLPADWLKLDDKGIRLDIDRSKNFGYEAIRIPLYLAMAGKKEELKPFIDYIMYFKNRQFLPAVVDLFEDQVSLDEAPAGFYAVFAAACKTAGKTQLSQDLMNNANQKIKEEALDYYSATLYLLAQSVIHP